MIAVASQAEDCYLVERHKVEAMFQSKEWRQINRLEGRLERLPQVKCALHHVFTPGLYCREILIPKGSLVTTRIHLTEHPFVISAGTASVWDGDDGVVTLCAPHTGVTKPGTRRVIFAHTDVIWSTFHVTNKKDPDEIVMDLTFSGGKFKSLRGAKS